MEKSTFAIKTELRADTYAGITDYLTSVGDKVEPGVNGLLVYDAERDMWMEISVTVKDEHKFDIGAARAAYVEKMNKAAARAEAAAVKARERADKAAAKMKENV